MRKIPLTRGNRAYTLQILIIFRRKRREGKEEKMKERKGGEKEMEDKMEGKEKRK